MEVMKVIPFSGCLHIWISLWQWQRLERIMCSVKCYWLIFKTLEYCTNISSVCAAQYEIAILPMNCGPGMGHWLPWISGTYGHEFFQALFLSVRAKAKSRIFPFFFFFFYKKVMWCTNYKQPDTTSSLTVQALGVSEKFSGHPISYY